MEKLTHSRAKTNSAVNLHMFEKNQVKFLCYYMTMDEIWIYHFIPTMKSYKENRFQEKENLERTNEKRIFLNYYFKYGNAITEEYYAGPNKGG